MGIFSSGEYHHFQFSNIVCIKGFGVKFDSRDFKFAAHGDSNCTTTGGAGKLAGFQLFLHLHQLLLHLLKFTHVHKKITPYFGRTSTWSTPNILIASCTIGSRRACCSIVSRGGSIVVFSLTMFVLARGGEIVTPFDASIKEVGGSCVGESATSRSTSFTGKDGTTGGRSRRADCCGAVGITVLAEYVVESRVSEVGRD